MSDELKPTKELYHKIDGYDDQLHNCPFCGSKAELWEYSISGDYFQKVAVCSKSEDDDTEECPMYMPPDGFYKATKKEAIEVWNTRQPSQVERLKERIDKLAKEEMEYLQPGDSIKIGYGDLLAAIDEVMNE